MPLQIENFFHGRMVPLEIDGKSTNILAMADPSEYGEKNKNSNFNQLKENNYSVISLNNNSHNGLGLEVTPVDIEDFDSPSIAQFKAIHDLISSGVSNGKSFAIHCKGGAGRTGTILAALKLKELLDDHFKKHEFIDERESENIVVATKKQNTAKKKANIAVCMPVVKEAIISVRALDDKNYYRSVETHSQVQGLNQYCHELIAEHRAVKSNKLNKPTNYRQIDFKFGDNKTKVAGMARPSFNGQNSKSMFDYLYNNGYSSIVSLDFSARHKKIAAEYGIDYINQNVTDFQPPTIKQFDDTYKIISDSLKEGKPVAVHCGEGFGRTGTMLAGLKLKEIMLDLAKNGKLAPETEADRIWVGHYGGDKLVPCSPLVKQAIDAVRAPRGSKNSVEIESQVHQLYLYQRKLTGELNNQLNQEPVRKMRSSTFNTFTQVETLGEAFAFMSTQSNLVFAADGVQSNADHFVSLIEKAMNARDLGDIVNELKNKTKLKNVAKKVILITRIMNDLRRVTSPEHLDFYNQVIESLVKNSVYVELLKLVKIEKTPSRPSTPSSDVVDVFSEEYNSKTGIVLSNNEEELTFDDIKDAPQQENQVEELTFDDIKDAPQQENQVEELTFDDIKDAPQQENQEEELTFDDIKGAPQQENQVEELTFVPLKSKEGIIADKFIEIKNLIIKIDKLNKNLVFSPIHKKAIGVLSSSLKSNFNNFGNNINNQTFKAFKSKCEADIKKAEKAFAKAPGIWHNYLRPLVNGLIRALQTILTLVGVNARYQPKMFPRKETRPEQIWKSKKITETLVEILSDKEFIDAVSTPANSQPPGGQK